MTPRLEYESDLEQYLVKRTAESGGVALKIGYDGYPDRLLLLPGGRAVFAELKRTDGKVSPLQEYRAQVMLRLGFEVAFPRSKDDCELILADALAPEWYDDEA